MQAPFPFIHGLQLDFPSVQAPTSSPTTVIGLPQMQAPASSQPRCVQFSTVASNCFLLSTAMNNSNASTFVAHHGCIPDFPQMQALDSYLATLIGLPQMQAPASCQPRPNVQFSAVASNCFLLATVSKQLQCKHLCCPPRHMTSFPQLQAIVSFWPRRLNSYRCKHLLLFNHHCVAIFPMASHCSSRQTHMNAANQVGKPTQSFTFTGVQIHQHRNANFSFHRF